MQNLTVRYSATQFTHWASATGATSLATAYLLGRGLSAGTAGTLLALGGLLSCLTQPILAAAADRSPRFLLRKMLLGMSLLCSVCYIMQMLPQLPLTAAGIFYMVAIWSADAMVPLLNALSVSCQQAGYPVNYGIARGLGTLASAVSTLSIGIILARFGSVWMFVFILFFRALNMLHLLRYPAIRKAAPDNIKKAAESCSIGQFFLRYPWYCASLVSIVFMGMYLAMTENYMITIMQPMGGDSSHVGTALFISSVAGAPVILGFNAIRKKISDSWLLKIAALGFLLRAVLVWQAESITAIFCIQLLQIVSYAVLAPTQVCHAEAKVCRADMVKGQAFTSAAFAMGCATGNFIGGQLLRWGVETLLRGGIVMALLGVVIIFLTANKTDSYRTAVQE